MFKIQVDDGDDGIWHDVKGTDGKPLLFENSEEAHRKLDEMFPVLTRMEKYVGPKRVRAIAILEDD
ncbi:MAG TPA: hypothetical protein VMT94_07720 [Burkholderiales bacterium]|nr:hypothetical protein [Burkholderiales bacterium]